MWRRRLPDDPIDVVFWGCGITAVAIMVAVACSALAGAYAFVVWCIG